MHQKTHKGQSRLLLSLSYTEWSLSINYCLQDGPFQSPLRAHVHQHFDSQLMNLNTRWATEVNVWSPALCLTLSAEFSWPLPCLLIIHRVTGEHKQGILSLYVFRHISFQSSSSCIKRRIKGSQGCCSHFHTQNGPSQ